MARWTIAIACLVVGGVAGTFVAGPLLRGQNAPVGPARVFPKELASYRDVVKNVLPAVVSIETRSRPHKVKTSSNPRGKKGTDDPRLPPELRKFLEEFGPMQPFDGPDDVPHGGGFGSGFLVDPKGVILTNNHVVDGADQVEVQLKDGRKFTSKDIHTDVKTDLAIVRIEAQTPLPYLELGDSDGMEIGDRVLAVGAPFGLTGSVTAGIISAKGRNGLSMNLYEDFLQTDAAINPGNSGGPLVNLEGKVIGINSAIKSRTGGFQGVGLAIASNLAKNVMQQLLTNGVVHRGYLGIQIQDIHDPDVAARLGVKEESGVVVGQVFAGSPAAKAGLQSGDVVTSIGGKPVKDGRELQRVVASLPLHKPVEVTVIREGKSQILPVTIEEQPGDFGTARVPSPRRSNTDKDTVKLDKLGVEVTDLTPEMADELGYKEGVTGALVTKVEEDSPAAEKGLSRGMVIVKVERQPVKSAAALRDLLAKAKPDKGFLLQVQTPQGSSFIVVKPETTTSSNK
jgi:serine protease Do